MLQSEESYPELSVLLAMADKETVRLLCVVLDGFGYKPIECHHPNDFYENLLITTPFAALVDMQMNRAEELCKMTSDHGDIQLVILLPDQEQDPEQQMQRLHADAWATAGANPETLLRSLRKLLLQKEST